MPPFRTPSNLQDRARDFVDTVALTQGDAQERVDALREGEADDDYAWRLALTTLALALYVGALALPAVGFVITGDSSSPVWMLQLWPLVPGDVKTGLSLLSAGWIGLLLAQVGAFGWVANVLFAIGVSRLWNRPSLGMQAKWMADGALGLALVSLPLTNLVPILANEAGSRMVAKVPLAGYWLWLAAMSTLWVASRIMTPLSSNSEGGWSAVWTRRFALIDKAGGADLPNKAVLTLGQRVQIRLNFWALMFGAAYYIVKGMWKKGLALAVTEIAIVGFLMTLAPQWHWAPWLVQGGFMLVLGTSANLDFYKLARDRRGMPTMHVRAFAFACMMLLGWVAALAINALVTRASRPLAEPAAPFPSIQPDSHQSASSHTAEALQETMPLTRARRSPAPPEIPSLSTPAPRQIATAAQDPLPFRLGESTAEVRRMVASRPDLSAAVFTAQEARFVQRGIWLFFDPNQTIREIRLDTPFSGAIQGIHLGDPISKLLTVLGSPDVPPFAFSGDLAHVYDRSGVAYRFDVGRDARVKRIFLIPEGR